MPTRPPPRTPRPKLAPASAPPPRKAGRGAGRLPAGGRASDPPKTRRRVATEQTLKAAVGKIMRRHGVEKLGVNAIAAEAGVDKVLIYRYFGDVEGLLRAYGESADFWPSLEELLGPNDEVLAHHDPGKLAFELYRNYLDALMRRPITLELMAWECVERGPLTAILEEVRERRSVELMERIVDAGFRLHPGAEEAAALLGAGLNYLCIRQRHVRLFAGLRLDDQKSWEALLKAMATMVRPLFSAPEPERRR